jgi:Sap-like sulfolipid-1-addressing protein
VSALPEALPFALGAAFYPPALFVLLLLSTGERPRGLIASYFAGAAVPTVGAGLIGLAILSGAGLTTQDSSTASGWVYIVVGLLLLALAAWAWRRAGRRLDAAPDDPGSGGSRIAEWSQRASASRRWAFVLGVAMFLPSPLYLLAVKDLADSGDSTPSQVLAVLICAIAVMLFVEVPLVAMYVRPGAVAGGLERFHAWLARNGWRLAAAVALIAGIYAIVKGVAALS